MADLIETLLPKKVKNKTKAMVAAALGLFLGLRYNSFFNEVINKYLPIGENMGSKALILVLTTFGVVYLLVYLEKI